MIPWLSSSFARSWVGLCGVLQLGSNFRPGTSTKRNYRKLFPLEANDPFQNPQIKQFHFRRLFTELLHSFLQLLHPSFYRTHIPTHSLLSMLKHLLNLLQSSPPIPEIVRHGFLPAFNPC